MPGYNQQYQHTTDTARIAGSEAEAEYLRRAKAFDPNAAAKRSAEAQFGSFRQVLNRDIGELRGQQVGMGRLNTGFATEDEDRLISTGVENLNTQIAGRSMQAAGMELENNRDIGQYGQSETQSYRDLLTGAMDRETAKKNAQRSRWKSLAGGLGALAGGLIAGPAGAQIGGAVGGGVGDFFG